jgi:hypothetical protein
MSPDRARFAANALVLSGAAALAYVLMCRPAVRRAVWRLSRPYLSRLPEYVTREIAAAWMQSGQPS